jgi:hypothetical protein
MWAEFSSSAPHLLPKGLMVSPIKWRCLLRVLCLVRRPITTYDCVLLKDYNLFFVFRLAPKISFRSCLRVQPRPRHCHAVTNDTGQRLLSTGHRKAHLIIRKMPQLCRAGLCEKLWESSAIKSELFVLKLTVQFPKLINMLNFKLLFYD